MPQTRGKLNFLRGREKKNLTLAEIFQGQWRLVRSHKVKTFIVVGDVFCRTSLPLVQSAREPKKLI